MSSFDLSSDAATGLPPLHEVVPEDAMLVVTVAASEGVAQVRGKPPIAVRYLSLRGLALDVAGEEPQWVQMHVAVPVETAMDVAAALAKGCTDDLSVADADGWGVPAEGSFDVFALRRIGEDAYLFSSRDKATCEVWLRRLREAGDLVELVGSSVSYRTFTRHADWQVIA